MPTVNKDHAQSLWENSCSLFCAGHNGNNHIFNPGLGNVATEFSQGVNASIAIYEVGVIKHLPGLVLFRTSMVIEGKYRGAGFFRPLCQPDR